MTRYPAAEKMAINLFIGPDDDLESLTERWALEYQQRFGDAAEPAMVLEAQALLGQRLELFPPPLPPSASSTSMRVPSLVVGLPREVRRATTSR